MSGIRGKEYSQGIIAELGHFYKIKLYVGKNRKTKNKKQKNKRIKVKKNRRIEE